MTILIFVVVETIGQYSKHIMIINDDSGVVSKWPYKLWCHLLTTLESSFTIVMSL